MLYFCHETCKREVGIIIRYTKKLMEANNERAISIFVDIILVFTFLTTDTFAKGESYGNTRVRGHIRKNGSVVTPHMRTKPDKSKFNNWNTKGNINPYTGKEGTQDIFK